MLEQGERLGACFRRRLDEWGRARDKCDVSLWDKVQEAAEKKEEPSGSGKTQWKRDSKKAADLDSKMCKLLDEIKDDAKKKERLCTDLDEAMGTAFPDEWRTEQQQMGKEGKQTEDGAQTRKKARFEDVEDSQLPCEDEEVTPLTEASVNSMNETIAKQDELKRAKRKNVAEQDEVLEKKCKGMAPESGKVPPTFTESWLRDYRASYVEFQRAADEADEDEEEEDKKIEEELKKEKEERKVQGQNPQEPKKQIWIAGRLIDKELAADEAKVQAYAEGFAVRVNAARAERLAAEEARAKEFAAQKKDQARGAAKQAEEMGKAKEAQALGPCLSIERPDKEVFEKLQKEGLLPKADETDKKAAETDKKAAETDKKAAKETNRRSPRSKRQLRETWPTLQDLFTFLRISGPSMAPSGAKGVLEMMARGFPCSLAPPPPPNLLSSFSWLHQYP